MHASDLVKEFLQRQWRSACIVPLKAKLGIAQSLMPSRSSAPSLPSPELYSLDHYLWYNGSTCTTPSPQEGDLKLREVADNCPYDNAAKDQSFHTATSSPTSPLLGGGGASIPALTEAVPHSGLACPAQDTAEGRLSSPLPE